MIALELDAFARFALDDAESNIHALNGKGERITVEGDVLNLVAHLIANLLQTFLDTREIV